MRWIGDLGKGFEFLFLEQIDGSLLRGPMNPLVSLLPPEGDLAVYFLKILTGGHPEKVLDVSDHPLHSPLLIGSSRGAGINREPMVAHKVQELGIEGQLRGPAQNDAFQIIIAVPMSHPSHLPEGSKVTVHEELHAVTGIEVDIEVSGVGQDQDKPIEDSKGKSPFHPVHLGLFPRQKLQLMKPSGLLFTKRPGIDLHGVVASRIPIPPQTLMNLGDP
jgi:hypothetical protein